MSIPRLDFTKSRTVPFDLLKLSGLRLPETDSVGLLLVGFEKLDDPMDADIETLRTLAGLSEWCESSDAWTSGTVPASGYTAGSGIDQSMAAGRYLCSGIQ